MNLKYKTLNNKIKKLKEQQWTNVQHTDKQNNHTFHKRTENLTDIIFTDTEIQLLDKGLKYNLHHKHNKSIHTLAIEANTAISQLPDKEQGYMRQVVAINIKKIINKEDAKKWKTTNFQNKTWPYWMENNKNIKTQNRTKSANYSEADNR
jgi:hypothetical protein